jgi:hypothetical protein
MDFMGKTIREKMPISKKVAVAAGLLGCLASAGCDYIGSFISASAPYSKDPRAGQAVYTLGQGMQANQNAVAGRSEVNVNVGNQDGNTQSNRNTSTPLVYTCGGTKEEIRHNKGIDIGKKVFYEGEYVGLIGVPAIVSMPKHSLINQTTYLPTGESNVAVEKEWGGEPGFDCYHIPASKLLELHGEGEFKNIWYVDGKPVAEVRFVVLRRR